MTKDERQQLETTKAPVYLDDVFDAMCQCYRQALTRGRNWHAVTVGTDGEPYVREEVNRGNVSREEYFREGRPHPVTVWGEEGKGSLDDNEVEEAVDAFDPVEELGRGGAAELRRRLEEAGFTVEG